MYYPWKELDSYRGSLFNGNWPTIPEILTITTSRFHNSSAFTAFSPSRKTFTYDEVTALVESISSHLKEIGILKGDKIGVLGKNSPEWAIAYLSILNMGGVVVPIDNGLSKNEVVELISISDCKVTFSDRDKLDYIKTNSLDLKAVFSLNDGDEEYILNLKGEDKGFEYPTENDIAAILYTSGTTGVSKGVMLTHKNLSSDAYLAQGNLKVYPSDVFYALLPIHHSYTMTSVFLVSLTAGAEIVFGKQLVFSQIVKDFKQGRVTMFLGVPLLFNKIINGLLKGVREKGIIIYGLIRFLMIFSGFIKKSIKINPGKKIFNFLLKKASLEHIRICISGGGPLAPSTFKQFNQLGIDFVQGYGLTEASPMIALNPIEKYKESSVGKIIDQVDAKIINKDENSIGDLVVKGPNVMVGYYKNEKATNEAFTKDGYLITGDVGYLDRDNYLYLTGRKSSLIVTEGGKNIYPEEIEDAFQLFDEIEQVLVKGYIKNIKTLAEGIEILFLPTAEFSEGRSQSDIKKHFSTIVSDVNKKLSTYKHIERIFILEEPLPMTTTKKIKRNYIINNYEEIKRY